MEDDRIDRVEQLEQRVARLDSEVARLRTRLGQVESPISSANSTASLPRPVRTADRAAWPAPQPAAAATRRVEPVAQKRGRLEIDSEALLKWGGVGLVVLAVGFAVSTAITRNWIGPELQLAVALIVSMAFVAAGLRLRSTRPAWTHALCSGGVLAFFTTFASDLFLDRANETTAFAATAVIAVGGLVLAHTIRSEWVAVATLVGGSIGWAVIAGSGDDIPFLVTTAWFVVIVIATLALSIERHWFAARPAAHAVGMIALLALAEQADGTARAIILAAATVLLAGSLFAVPSIGDLTSRWQQLEVELTAAAAPWAFLMTRVAFLDDRGDIPISMVAFAIAALTVIAAVALPIRRPHLISLALGASVTFSIGLAVLLSATAVFVAFAVQAAGLIVLSKMFGGNLRILVNAAVLVTIAVVNTLAAMVVAWSDDDSWADDIAHLLVIVAMVASVWFVDERDIRRVGAIATLAMFLVWSGSVFVHAPQGQAVVSVVWATTGTLVFVTGAVRRRADAASTGLAVLALTVGKLLTVDLREVDALWRAGLFFVVGIGLLRLGFLLPQLTHGNTTDDESFDQDHHDEITPVDTDP